MRFGKMFVFLLSHFCRYCALVYSNPLKLKLNPSPNIFLSSYFLYLLMFSYFVYDIHCIALGPLITHCYTMDNF